MQNESTIRSIRNKWAMCGYKGGKCVNVNCKKRVTEGELGNFHFDHKIPIKNAWDKSDRWGNAIRYWAPFTDEWFAWAETVDLICAECHRQKHRAEARQVLFDTAAQLRLDLFEPGPPPSIQQGLFECS